VCHPRDADELLKVLGDELRAIVGDDARPGVGELLLGPLERDFHFGLRHGLAQAPSDQIAAGPIEHGARIVERAVDVDVGDVDVPMFMRLEGLLETRAFFAGLVRPPAQAVCLAQHAKDARRANGHHIGVDHHVSKPPVAFQRVLRLIVQNGLLLPLLAWQSEPVPPMSIQTLVENAVKYAVDPAPEGGSIIVSAERTDDMLWVRVRDSGVGFRIEDSPKGHGLENLRARLDLVYGAPGKAGLRVYTRPGGCCVEMFTPASGATA
jgi:hypothetical protein